MLSAIRKFAKSWVAILLVGLLIVSFAVWGVRDAFSAKIADWVVQSGSRTVDGATFKRIFDNAKKQVEQRAGQPITVEMAVENGVDAGVLKDLADQESLLEMLNRMGVRPSDDLVEKQLREIPAFFDPVTLAFDKKAYARLLAENGMRPDEFERQIRDQTAQQHFVFAAAAGLHSPRIYRALVGAYFLENRDVSVISLPPTAVPAPPPPTDQQLLEFIKKDSQRFTIPEMRVLTIVRFSSKAAEPTVAIDAAEVAKRFEFRKESLSTAERRSVVQIPAKDAAAAAQAAERLKKGEKPEAIAKALGVEAVSYDDKPKSAIADRKVADAAFALPAGGVSGPIKGDLGYAVVKVSLITPGRTASLEEVRPQIEAELRQEAAQEKIYELTQKYEDAHAEGGDILAASAKAGVRSVSVGPINAQGRMVGPQTAPAPEVTEKLLKTAFELPSGGESEVEEDEGKGEYYVVKVDKILPPTLVPLNAEFKPLVTRDYMAGKFREALAAKSEQLAGRLRRGESVEAVAAAGGGRVERMVGVTRQSAGQNQAIGQALGKAFGAKAGEVYTTLSPGGYLIVKLDAIRPAAPNEIAALVEMQKDQSGAQMIGDLEQSAVLASRKATKTKTDINRARQALGLDPEALKEPAEKKK